MRRLLMLWVAICGLLWSAPALAQQGTARMTIAGGYGFLHQAGVGASPSANYNLGWVVAIGLPAGHSRFAVAGEIGGQYRSVASIETHSLYGFLGGVTIDLVRASRMTVFAQTLAGLERFSAPGFSESGFAVQPGAGLDVRLSHRFGVRVQGDARFAHEEGVTFHEFRVIVCAVFAVGHQ